MYSKILLCILFAFIFIVAEACKYICAKFIRLNKTISEIGFRQIIKEKRSCVSLQVLLLYNGNKIQNFNIIQLPCSKMKTSISICPFVKLLIYLICQNYHGLFLFPLRRVINFVGIFYHKKY